MLKKMLPLLFLCGMVSAAELPDSWKPYMSAKNAEPGTVTLQDKMVRVVDPGKGVEAGITKTKAECAPHLLEQAARAGDTIARHLYKEFAEKLSVLIMNLMYTFVPEAIISGGGVAQAGDLLLTPLTESLKQQLFPVHYKALSIRPARFGADAGLIGAGLMAADYADNVLL